MGFLKKLYRNLSISIAVGLKNAESAILKQKLNGNSSDSSIEQQVATNELADALVKGVVTEEVELLRDRNYMVIEAASKIKITDVDHEKGTYTATKINPLMVNKPKVFEEKNYISKIIMEIKNTTKNDIDMISDVGKNNEVLVSPLDLEYEDVPKYKLERYVRKVVLRKKDKAKKDVYRLDLYVPKFTDSNERMERIFDAEINKIKVNKSLPLHIEFKTIEFITDQAYGSDDLCKYKFKFKKFVSVNEFNGSNVLTYDIETEIFNEKITDKFIKPELRKKYKNVEKKNVKLTADFRDLKV